MNTNKQNKNFSVIGCGRLGTNLAVFLAKSGYTPAAFSSRRIESARRTGRLAGGGKAYENPVDAAKQSSLVFITTPDTVIESVCEKIAQGRGINRESNVFHLSGALDSSILRSARKTGAGLGSIHPLQAFAPYEKGQASPFKGINMSIEGDDRAVASGQEIVKALKANSFTIPTKAKTLYHASAVVASNYLVTLENFALELMKQADLTEEKAYDILEPLIMGTLNNIKNKGSINALTGPVARGDDEIVAKHLADIDKTVPQFSSLYRLLGQYTLDIADQRGDLDRAARLRLSILFNSRIEL